MCIPTFSTDTERLHVFHSTIIGFSAKVDQQLLNVVKLENKLNQYVILVLDKMHIKKELVYDEHKGELTHQIFQLEKTPFEV